MHLYSWNFDNWNIFTNYNSNAIWKRYVDLGVLPTILWKDMKKNNYKTYSFIKKFQFPRTKSQARDLPIGLLDI